MICEMLVQIDCELKRNDDNSKMGVRQINYFTSELTRKKNRLRQFQPNNRPEKSSISSS